jgi:hypothetical protein
LAGSFDLFRIYEMDVFVNKVVIGNKVLYSRVNLPNLDR